MELRERLHSQWTESAQDWIETDQAVRTGMLDRWMLSALGNVSAKSVIDIGCGEGRFCRLLSQLGATVTGVDLTDPFIERARALASEGETYLIGDAENLHGIADDSFDLAVSYIVLVDLLNYRRSISEAYRALRPGGRFVVCNIHPMRSGTHRLGWITHGNRKLFYPLDNYTDEGPREWMWWDKPFINMHRTLSCYISAFLEVGFALNGLYEPTPSDKELVANPSFDDEFRAPNFIIYALEKPNK